MKSKSRKTATITVARKAARKSNRRRYDQKVKLKFDPLIVYEHYHKRRKET